MPLLMCSCQPMNQRNTSAQAVYSPAFTNEIPLQAFLIKKCCVNHTIIKLMNVTGSHCTYNNLWLRWPESLPYTWSIKKWTRHQQHNLSSIYSCSHINLGTVSVLRQDLRQIMSISVSKRIHMSGVIFKNWHEDESS